MGRVRRGCVPYSAASESFALDILRYHLDFQWGGRNRWWACRFLSYIEQCSDEQGCSVLQTTCRIVFLSLVLAVEVDWDLTTFYRTTSLSSTLYIGGGNTATYVHAYKHFPDILGLCSCSDEALPDEREFEVLSEETLEGENISDRSQQ